MTDRQTRRLPLIAATLAGLSLAACTQTFTDEGSDQPAVDEGNVAKAMLISMGAIDDPHAAAAPKFQPRPALVVPPKRTLPQPVDEQATLESKGFPVDPEVRSERERTERLKGGLDGSGNRVLSLDEQARFKDLPTAGAPAPQQSANDHDMGRTLKPWELDGKAQATELERVQNTGPAAKERSLLAPPTDYRTPSDKAPLESPPQGIAAVKPSWWPF